jgi:hypothetical protein
MGIADPAVDEVGRRGDPRELFDLGFAQQIDFLEHALTLTCL